MFVAQICSSVCPEHYSVLEETDCISGLESRKSFICPTTQNLALLVTSLSLLNAYSITESMGVEHWDVCLCVHSSLVVRSRVERETGNTQLQ